MKAFSRGSLLVAVLDLFQSVLGIIIGCKGWALYRNINSQVTIPQESNIQFQFSQVGNYLSQGLSYYNEPIQEIEERPPSYHWTSQIYFCVALYFVVLFCVLTLSINLIFGIRFGSSLKIKLWLYPNLGIIVLSGVFMLLYLIFKSNDITSTVTVGVISIEITGALIFRALQCWIVNEALSEIPKDEMYTPERTEHTMPSSDKRAGVPSEITGHLGSDSVI